MKSFLLIGLGRFGRHLAMQLNAQGHQVMAVDDDEEKVNAVLNVVTNAQIGDSTNGEFLQELGVGNYDVCIVAISDNFQSSLETTSLLKELGAKKVVSRAERDVQAKFLLRNGADEVLYPEKQLAKWAAVRYGSDHLLDYIELASGRARPSARSTCAASTTSTCWRSSGRAPSTPRSPRTPCFPRTAPCWPWANTGR